MEELRDLFNYSVEHKGGLLNAMLMKNDEGDCTSCLFDPLLLSSVPYMSAKYREHL